MFRIGQSMQWHVLSTIPRSFSLSLEWSSEVVWNPPDIGSEDVSWLFSAPDLALSNLIHNGWDFDESQSSPNVIVTSDIPECPSISSSDDVTVISSEWEG